MRPCLTLAIAVALAACAREAAPGEPPAKALSCAASEGGAVSAEGAWLREQKDASAVTAAYFSLCNGSMKPATLVGVTTPLAAETGLHETTRDANGLVSMAPISEVTLAPGERALFEPGGKHAMLHGLAGPIAGGDHAELTLLFADGATLTLEAVAKTPAEAASVQSSREGR